MQVNVPIVPIVPQATRTVVAPLKEDLVKQVKFTGARYQRHKFRVTVRANHGGLAVPGGYVLPPGTHEIVVDESEIPTLQALLETEEAAVAQAKAEFERRLIQEADEDQGGTAWRTGVDQEDAQKIIKASALKTGNSIEAVFSERMGRGILPLTKIEQLTTEPLPPIELDSDVNVNGVAAAFATAFAQAQQSLAAAQPQPQQNQNGKRQG